MVPTPPASLAQINTLDLPAGTHLYRIHLSTFDGDQFNPCLGNPTRFAPISDAAGKCIPTMYAADTLECAVFETIFHNVPVAATLKVVRLGEVLVRSYSVVETRWQIRLAKFFGPDLNALGVTRKQITQTLAAHYTKTALWAAAFHHQGADLDGLVWTSNQCDPNQAYILLGDRQVRGSGAGRAVRGDSRILDPPPYSRPRLQPRRDRRQPDVRRRLHLAFNVTCPTAARACLGASASRWRRQVAATPRSSSLQPASRRRLWPAERARTSRPHPSKSRRSCGCSRG